MEVPHHSHTPDSHRERTKWTHYFWEFFMLFLAVTLGFLVENQREHYIEHLRVKEFAKSPGDSLFKLTDMPVKNDPDLMREYTGWLKFESGIYQYQNERYVSSLRHSAIELLEILEKEYHLK